MQLILQGLAEPMDFDLRGQFSTPLFRKGLTSIDDLKPGMRLTGKLLHWN